MWFRRPSSSNVDRGPSLFCFRIRVDVARNCALGLDEPEFVFTEPGASPKVRLRTGDDATSLREARRLAVIGSGYATAEDAESAAREWRSKLLAVFIELRFGVDFGDRAPQGGFTADGLAALSAR